MCNVCGSGRNRPYDSTYVDPKTGKTQKQLREEDAAKLGRMISPGRSNNNNG